MVVIIEIDKQWTVGVDWFDKVKGVRLGFAAIHFTQGTFEDILDSKGETE
jgi:hypothetical protein